MREDVMTEVEEGVTRGHEPGMGVPPEGGKSKETDCPLGPPNGMQLSSDIGVGPVRPIWTSDLQNCQTVWVPSLGPTVW